MDRMDISGHKGKLHEILAVETDLQSKSNLIAGQVHKVFTGKQDLFVGSIRTFESLYEDRKDVMAPDEYKHLTDTVKGQLQFLADAMIPYIDVVCQKDATNQVAMADIVVDGKVLCTGLPSTFLLGLESKLKSLREVYASIPTLKAGIEWQKSNTHGEDVYEAVVPDVKLKTEMQFKSQVLYEATDRHPAQIEKWQEQVPVGKFTKKEWSSCLTSERKSQLLSNIDTLIIAVKQARQRANMTPVVSKHVGKKLFDFING